MESSRPQALEAGLFLIVVALPLAFFPLSEGVFIDVKLLVLALGTPLVWVSGVPVDRHLAAPALALGVAFALATALGVDPAASLVGAIRPTGIVTLACTLVLVVVAPSLSEPLVARARVWMVRAAVVLAAVAVVEHIAPELLDAVARRESFLGATFGNPVLLAGFLAASIPAAFGDGGGSRWRTIAVFAALGSGFAVIGERSAYLLPLTAFVATWWFLRPPAGRIAVAGDGPRRRVRGVDAASDVGLGEHGPITRRGSVLDARSRAPALRRVGRADPRRRRPAGPRMGTLERVERVRLLGHPGPAPNSRPLLGRCSQPPDRGGGDLGCGGDRRLPVAPVPAGAEGRARAAGTRLGRRLCRHARRVLPLRTARRHADPRDVLLAGAAAGERAVVAAPAVAWRRPARVATALVLIAATGVAAINLTSASLERWGRTHAGSKWAFERAWAIAPWRVSPAEALEIELAIDARAGDPTAAARAREVVDRLIDAHPLNPGLRLLAADVELLLMNFPGTQEWIRRQLEVFPSDTVRVPEEEPGITLPG